MVYNGNNRDLDIDMVYNSNNRDLDIDMVYNSNNRDLDKDSLVNCSGSFFKNFLINFKDFKTVSSSILCRFWFDFYFFC